MLSGQHTQRCCLSGPRIYQKALWTKSLGPSDKARYIKFEKTQVHRTAVWFFKKMLLSTGIITKRSVTIASHCNRVFLQEFLEDNTTGLIPAQGYQPIQNYSTMAPQWLSWIHHQKGDWILNALNGGEQCIGNSYVDGYDPVKKTIYEFMGCLWHGCHKC